MVGMELHTAVDTEIEFGEVTVGKAIGGTSDEGLALNLMLVSMGVGLRGVAENLGIYARQIGVGGVQGTVAVLLIVAHEHGRYVVLAERLVVVNAQFIEVVIHVLVLIIHRNLGVGVDGVLLHHRSEEHTSELQSRQYLVCRLLLEKKK